MTELVKLSMLHTACFPNRPWTADDFAELKQSGAEIILSDNSFLVYRQAADELEIITLGVHPDFRRSGTANALLGIMENDARKSGVRGIFLEVGQDNDAAIALYTKNGYKEIGIRKRYYNGVNAITMEKIIN